MEDTVEKNVEGLAEQIILEDEQRRAQELVSTKESVYYINYYVLTCHYRMYLTLRPNDPTGISSVTWIKS
jgi:hypothetical protein